MLVSIFIIPKLAEIGLLFCTCRNDSSQLSGGCNYFTFLDPWNPRYPHSTECETHGGQRKTRKACRRCRYQAPPPNPLPDMRIPLLPDQTTADGVTLRSWVLMRSHIPTYPTLSQAQSNPAHRQTEYAQEQLFFSVSTDRFFYFEQFFELLTQIHPQFPESGHIIFSIVSVFDLNFFAQYCHSHKIYEFNIVITHVGYSHPSKFSRGSVRPKCFVVFL